MSCYTHGELAALGLGGFGKDVRLSRKASLYNPGNIFLGDHVRVDDFCVLSAGAGGIEIGNYIHIAVFSSLIGAGRIEVRDFANLSSRVSIYSSNDDYSGRFMTNPMVPSAFTGVSHADVVIGRHVIVGCGTVILPGAVLEEGAAIGSLSLIKNGFTCRAFGTYVGVPARRIGDRSRHLLEVEKEFRASLTKSGSP